MDTPVISIPAAKILFNDEDRQEIIKRIDHILSTGKLTLGAYGEEFENLFAKLCGTKYAVAVSSGTSSLEIILRSWGITSGKVLVPTNTFFASPAAVLHAGAQVKFVDMDPNTLSPSLDQFKKEKDKNTRAVMIVHIGGILSNELAAIRTWCDQEDLMFLEDAAHAHGSKLDGKAAGSFGHAASFSFYPTKVITSGEGGMIVTDDEKLAVDARRYRDQGKESFTVNLHTRLGNNWRMSEIHASIGIQQLKRLPYFLEERRRASKQIQIGLRSQRKISCYQEPPGVKSNYYKFMALLNNEIDRKNFKRKLKENFNVSLAGEVYELPCHKQPIFQNYINDKNEPFPNAEEFCRNHICLPMYVGMHDKEINYMVSSINEVLND